MISKLSLYYIQELMWVKVQKFRHQIVISLHKKLSFLKLCINVNFMCLFEETLKETDFVY